MATLKRTFPVEVVAPFVDGPFTILFKVLPLNQALQEQKESRAEESTIPEDEKVWFWYKRILRNAVEIVGLQDEDGKALTPEDFRELSLPLSVLSAIIDCYNEAQSGKKSPEKSNGVTE